MYGVSPGLRTSRRQPLRPQPPPNPVRTVRSVISQRRAFSVLPVRLLRRSSGIFSVATIICSSLTYWLSESGTGRWGWLPDGIRPAVLAAFSARCFRVASCTNG